MMADNSRIAVDAVQVGVRVGSGLGAGLGAEVLWVGTGAVHVRIVGGIHLVGVGTIWMRGWPQLVARLYDLTILLFAKSTSTSRGHLATPTRFSLVATKN